MITTAPEEIARRQAKQQLEGQPEFGVERPEETSSEEAPAEEKVNPKDPYTQADNNL
jgi:hypothetical protein